MGRSSTSFKKGYAGAFKKGQSGNPAGRPRGKKDKVPRSVKKKFIEFAKEFTDSDEFQRAVKRGALKGQPKHIELLLHYGQGKPAETVNLNAEVHSYEHALAAAKGGKK